MSTRDFATAFASIVQKGSGTYVSEEITQFSVLEADSFQRCLFREWHLSNDIKEYKILPNSSHINEPANADMISILPGVRV